MTQKKRVIHVSIHSNTRKQLETKPGAKRKPKSVRLSLQSVKSSYDFKQTPSLPEPWFLDPIWKTQKLSKKRKTRIQRTPLWTISCGIICSMLGLICLSIIIYAIVSNTLPSTSVTTTTEVSVTISMTSTNTTGNISSTTAATTHTSTSASTSVNTTTTTSIDATTSTTTAFNSLPRINASGNTIAGTPGPQAMTPSRFNFPFGIALDSTETSIYIADQYNNRVQKWLIGEPNGTTVAGQTNAATGTGPTVLNIPTDILIDSSNNLYVSDYNNNRVQLWYYGATSGVTVAGNGTAGNTNNQLDGPVGLALDSSTGALFIVDARNYRVMRYSANATYGTVVAGGNGGGISRTQLLHPRGVYFESSSNSLLIANYGAHNIVRWIIGANNWTLIAGSPTGSSGSLASLLNGPYDVTVDPMGNIYVADTYNNRIQAYLPGETNGTTIIGTTGVSGSTATQLYQPFALLFDSQLNLYVSDTYNQRVQKFIRY